MRIVGGSLGGRTLHAPPGRATRPTPERVREALFSILSDRTVGAQVLDLFAGSGALGIEALSRGAVSATFVDSSRAAIAAIQRNLTELDLEAETASQSVASFLERARSGGRHYDLVFLDPPYRHAASLGRDLSRLLEPVLAPNAVVAAESDRRSPLELDSLRLLDERRYGDTLIRIHNGPR